MYETLDRIRNFYVNDARIKDRSQVPASGKQKHYLKSKWGIRASQVDKMSMEQASQMITELRRKDMIREVQSQPGLMDLLKSRGMELS